MPRLHFVADPVPLEDLTRDLTAARRGEFPTSDQLHAAPVLDQWFIAETVSLSLVGRVSGHPLLGSGRWITTSQLYALQPAGFWARTHSRLYKLGAPHHSGGTFDD